MLRILGWGITAIVALIAILALAGVLEIHAAEPERRQGWILKVCLQEPLTDLCRPTAVWPTQDFCERMRQAFARGLPDLVVKCEYGADWILVD